MPGDIEAERIMKLLDATLLKAFSTEKQIEDLVNSAARCGAYSVCILPLYASFARKLIASNKYDLRLAVVADFPLGGKTTTQRGEEIMEMSGVADEIDIVAQIGMAKTGNFEMVGSDLTVMADVAHEAGMKLKVIIETAYLTGPEKEKVSELVFSSGADFIKTSTGFADRDYTASIGNQNTGATVENISLFADVSQRMGKQNVGIKASGGVKTLAQMLELLAASKRATDPAHFRIGTSSAEAIYNELKGKK